MGKRKGGVLSRSAKGAIVWLVEIGEISADSIKSTYRVEEIFIGNTHPGSKVAIEAGGLAEVFAEKKKVVPSEGISKH